MAFERSESIVKSVHPYTLLTANFGKAKMSLLYGTTALHGGRFFFSCVHVGIFLLFFCFQLNP